MIEKLIGQFSGAQYGELVEEHFRKEKKNEILAAFGSINNELKDKFKGIDFSPLLETWHDASNHRILFKGDCGKIFKQINSSFSEYIGYDYSILDEDFLNFFNLVTLNLAFNVHLDSQYKKHFYSSFHKSGFLSKIFLSKEETIFLDFWEKDNQILENFDPFEYSRIFTKSYFTWLYKDFGFNVAQIRTYFYKKHHILGLAHHHMGNNLFSTKRVLGNFIEITYRVHSSRGLTSEIPYLIDCQSLSMANKLVNDFISERHGIENKDWEILGSAYLSNNKIQYGTIRTIFGNHKNGKFKYYFDFSKPNSNPLNKII